MAMGLIWVKAFYSLAISALVTGIDESVLVAFILNVAGVSLALSIRVPC